MKKIAKIWIVSCLALLSVSGCNKDEGNYNYISEDELISVQIGSLQELSVKANSLLTVTPQLNNADDSRYSYMWYTISEDYPYKKDTLSIERNLSVNCNLEVGDYKLYFEVKDVALDIYKNVTTSLMVTASDINKGWYVMKYINGNTDLDYFGLSGENRNNVLTDVLGSSALIGKPVGMVYLSKSYNHEKKNSDGTTTMLYSQSVYQIVSNKDMITLNANDMSVFKTLDNEFYEKPSETNFQYIAIDNYDTTSLVNGNEVHFLGTAIGKWGYQSVGDFDFFPFIFTSWFDTYLYDRKNNLFYNPVNSSYCYPYGMDQDEFTSFDDKEILNLLQRSSIASYTSSVYGLFRGNKDGKYYISELEFWFSIYMNNPIFYELSSTDDLPSADVMTAPLGPSVIYYATGHLLKIHKVNLDVEETVKTFGSDEKITYIKNIKGTESNGTSFNDLFVATNSANGYKIYRFPLIGSSGEIDTSSSAVMTGTGEAYFILFRNE